MRGAIASSLWVVLLLAGSARAEEPRAASFSWVRLEGAQDCGSAREIAASVEGLLGSAALVPASRAELFIEGHVRHVDGVFVAELRLSDGTGAHLGTRMLQDASCAELARTVSLAVAVMIDPDAAMRAAEAMASTTPGPESPPAAEPTPEPAATPEPATSPPFEPEAPDAPEAPNEQPNEQPNETTPVEPANDRITAEPEPADDDAPRWTLGLRVGAGFAFGALPSVPYGGVISLYVIPPGFVPIELEGVLLAEQSDELRAGSGADLSSVLGGVAICPVVVAPDPLDVYGCAGAQLGTIRSRGFGFDIENDDEAAFAAFVLRVRASVAIAGPLRLSTAAALAVPFVRQRFFATSASGEERELFRVAPVIGQLEASIELRFF